MFAFLRPPSLALAAAMLIAAPAAAGAQTFEEAVTAYRVGDYATALAWFCLAAEQGDAKAQILLGFGYAKGEGALQDFAMAHMWYNLAAAGGAKAQPKAATSSRN